MPFAPTSSLRATRNRDSPYFPGPADREEMKLQVNRKSLFEPVWSGCGGVRIWEGTGVSGRGSWRCRGRQACEVGEASVSRRIVLRRGQKSGARVLGRTAGGCAAQSSKTGTSSIPEEGVVGGSNGLSLPGERSARKLSSLCRKSRGGGARRPSGGISASEAGQRRHGHTSDTE